MPGKMGRKSALKPLMSFIKRLADIELEMDAVSDAVHSVGTGKRGASS